jgi:hypothetical protein
MRLSHVVNFPPDSISSRVKFLVHLTEPDQLPSLVVVCERASIDKVYLGLTNVPKEMLLESPSPPPPPKFPGTYFHGGCKAKYIEPDFYKTSSSATLR